MGSNQFSNEDEEEESFDFHLILAPQIIDFLREVPKTSAVDCIPMAKCR